MAFAELWLPIIGAGIFVAWSIGAWYGGNKTLSIWLAFSGAVCLLLLGTLQWQHAIKKSEITDKPSDATIKQLRAYVFLEEAKVTGIDKLQKIVAVVHFKNSGQTPAYNVANNLNISIRAPDDTDFSLSDAPALSGTLGPGATGHSVIELPPTNEVTRDGILNGQALLTIHGRITYTDTFGKVRITNYRAKALRDGGFSPITEGNESD